MGWDRVGRFRREPTSVLHVRTDYGGRLFTAAPSPRSRRDPQRRAGPSTRWTKRRDCAGSALSASDIHVVGCTGARRRSAKMNGSIASTQNIPTPRYVWRQPTVAIVADSLLPFAG